MIVSDRQYQFESLDKIDLPIQKRLFDIVASVLLLLILSPLFLIVSAWIAVEQLVSPSSRGPLLFHQTRLSQGKPFELYKIRIFKRSVLGPLENEGRVIDTKSLEQRPENMTYYGRVLCKAYLDESPQLLNVLRGDLTMVGPRPTHLEGNAKLTRLGLNTKEQMKCGLTGPYQAGKGTQRPTDYEMDKAYIELVAHSSGWKVLSIDLRILYQTIGAVLRAAGE